MLPRHYVSRISYHPLVHFLKYIKIYKYTPLSKRYKYLKIQYCFFLNHSFLVFFAMKWNLQLCVWSIDGWEKKKSRYIKHPSNGYGALVGDTMVQFHYDGPHLLVVHESQLAIYDWQLECLCSVSHSQHFITIYLHLLVIICCLVYWVGVLTYWFTSCLSNAPNRIDAL